MEILEVIFAAGAGLLEWGDGCLCLMQLVAMFVDGTSLFTGYRAVRENRNRKTLRQAGETPEGRNTYARALWLLIPSALLITAFVILTMARSWQR